MSSKRAGNGQHVQTVTATATTEPSAATVGTLKLKKQEVVPLENYVRDVSVMQDQIEAALGQRDTAVKGMKTYRGLWMEEREKSGNMVVAIPGMVVVLDMSPDEALGQFERDMAALPEIQQAYQRYANA